MAGEKIANLHGTRRTPPSIFTYTLASVDALPMQAPANTIFQFAILSIISCIADTVATNT